MLKTPKRLFRPQNRHLSTWVHQNRASPFASDFYRREWYRCYRRKFRSEDHFYPVSSQRKSRIASDFLRRGNRASWGLKKSRDFWGSGKNRRRSRRESRDFALIFLSLLFLKAARKTTKKARNFLSQRTLKSLGKKEKTLKKTRNSLGRKKARNSKKARKGRSGWCTQLSTHTGTLKRKSR